MTEFTLKRRAPAASHLPPPFIIYRLTSSVLQQPRPPRASYVEQSWNNLAAKSLRLPAFAHSHCPLDSDCLSRAARAVTRSPTHLQTTRHQTTRHFSRSAGNNRVAIPHQ